MKLALVTLIIVAVLCLIGWVTDDEPIGHLSRLLPFLGGYEPGLYDFAALTMLGIAIWGWMRMSRPARHDSTDDGWVYDEPDENNDPEDDN